MDEQLSKKILEKLDEHGEKLDNHGKILDEHSKILDKQSKLLDEHSRMLNQQSDLLTQLIKIVKSTNETAADSKSEIVKLNTQQQTIIEIQQEQQKILERLSFRSISHEADIARLRQIK